MVQKKSASVKPVISEEVQHEIIQPDELKAVHIYFDDNQIPKITFSGKNWSIRDILHIKRLLTREYKRYLRTFRVDVKKEEN